MDRIRSFTQDFVQPLPDPLWVDALLTFWHRAIQELHTFEADLNALIEKETSLNPTSLTTFDSANPAHWAYIKKIQRDLDFLVTQLELVIKRLTTGEVQWLDLKGAIGNYLYGSPLLWHTYGHLLTDDI